MVQQDVFGPADTGGALWYADRVMSEFLAAGAMDVASDPAPINIPAPS
eukprot:CAMPEP_0115753814 /NCGR_PEP_ID=MMETSP0272-20121206/96531_1 /TAXON_ID=71861 /ORGANISM="Scrippsiella trochoidea, Strain CCMP3099" /LENGTH=47 /DNA_ID= /DNA_START= /DNA_END= /DNA_ORIENTATION=